MYTLEGLRDAGVAVELLCRRGTPLEERAREACFTVHALPGQGGALAFLAFRGRAYDLVHAQSGKGHSLAFLAKLVHRRPLIYTRRVNFVQTDLFSKLKYRFTDGIVAISSAIRDTLSQTTSKPVELISSAVKQLNPNLKRVEALRNELKLEGKKIIATTGDLVDQKDPVTMVETIRHLMELRQDVVFLHFGTMGDEYATRIPAMIRDYSLEDRYLLLGHYDGVEDYFPLFDIYLVTGNHTEGLNSSVFDAFIYRVPVVSTLTGGMLDSVADRGLTCEEGDAACLANQLNRLLDDPTLQEQMRERAYDWVTSHVTIAAVTRDYLEVYRNLLKR